MTDSPITGSHQNYNTADEQVTISQSMRTNSIAIFDTTLRDGEQAPGFSMDERQKLRMAEALLELKVNIIEAGFPIASPGDFKSVKAIAELASSNPETTICGLSRASEADILAAGEAIAPAAHRRIHTFIATSPIHREYKLRMSKQEVLERAAQHVMLAKTLADEVEFSAEDAIRTEPEYLVEVFSAAIEAGASVINVPDTVGYTTPDEIEGLFRYLGAHVKGVEGVTLSAHCHDDLGMAVANSLAAIRGGARQVECAINGIGERAGNCSLEEVVMALHTRADHFGVETSLDTTKLFQASRLLESLTGQAVPRNKAIVGDNAFAHESGIHQDGVLKNIQTYEIMKPENVGAPNSKLVMGKHSGRNALADKARVLGHNLSGARLDEVFAEFKILADTKREVTDEDVKSLILGREIATDGPWRVTHVETTGSHDQGTTSVVTLTYDEGPARSITGRGNGPVDAAFQAIKNMTELDVRLEEFNVKSVGGGADAQGWANVRLKDLRAVETPIAGGGEAERAQTVHGSGVHTDIVIASVIAYLDAVNRLIKGEEAMCAN